MTDLLTPTESELASLADGTLQGERRERLLERTRSSVELATALREQQRALQLIDAVAVKAPTSLHASLDEMLGQPTRRGRRVPSLIGHLRGARVAAGAAAGLAAAAAALALVLASGGSDALTVQQAVAITMRPATMTAPAESRSNRSQLNVSMEGVSFPYWKERFGWSSAGARIDRVGGRRITTVFYADAGGRRIGYAIVSGQSLPVQGGRIIWRAGVPYRLLIHDGATVVAWPRGGHLCVVSGRGVDSKTLLHLAWSAGEQITST